MIVLPRGSYLMGSDRETGREGDEGPPHRVWLTQFAVGKFEVTVGQWAECVAQGACRGADADIADADLPIVGVNWDDVQAYVHWLAARTGQPYRLLSESEWEYAARAGTHTPFSTGWDISLREANYQRGPGHPVRVGSYAPNQFGLFDMHGNVWEWVEDCRARRYSHLPTNGAAYEPARCDWRVARGGGWDDHAAYVRSANRSYQQAFERRGDLGFRVARALN